MRLEPSTKRVASAADVDYPFAVVQKIDTDLTRKVDCLGSSILAAKKLWFG